MKNISVLLGLRNKNIRKGNGWSQEELGHRSGLHTSYIGQVERGERNPSLDSLHKIAAAFQLSLCELFYGIDPIPANKSLPINQQLYDFIITCSEEQQLKILDLLKLSITIK